MTIMTDTPIPPFNRRMMEACQKCALEICENGAKTLLLPDARGAMCDLIDYAIWSSFAPLPKKKHGELHEILHISIAVAAQNKILDQAKTSLSQDRINEIAAYVIAGELSWRLAILVVTDALTGIELKPLVPDTPPKELLSALLGGGDDDAS
jgi:hypothetical protein